MTKENNKLKHISNSDLLQEVKQRLANQIITRRSLLELAGIRYCLECKKDSAEQLTIEGFCPPCETN